MISNIHYNKIYIQYAYSEKCHKYEKKQLWSYCIPILDYFGLAASCCLVSLHSTQTYMYQLTKKIENSKKNIMAYNETHQCFTYLQSAKAATQFACWCEGPCKIQATD